MLWAGVPPNGRMTTTETRRHTPGQAVRKVREGGRMLGYRSHQSLGGLTPPPTLTTGRPTSTNHHE